MSDIPTAVPGPDAEALWKAEQTLPFGERQYFLAGTIALRLSRVPGRLEKDEEEAIRILDNLAHWCARGEVSPDEVLVIDVIENPPSFKPAVPRLADSYSEILPIDWRDIVILSRRATGRFLANCQLLGASRLMLEFGFNGDIAKPRAPTSKSPQPSDEELDKWMSENAGKRDQTLTRCRNETGATWRHAETAWKRLRTKHGLKRGQKTPTINRSR